MSGLSRCICDCLQEGSRVAVAVLVVNQYRLMIIIAIIILSSIFNSEKKCFIRLFKPYTIPVISNVK